MVIEPYDDGQVNSVNPHTATTTLTIPAFYQERG